MTIDRFTTVVGGAKFPLGTPDYSSFLLTANSSPANIFALSTVGGETVTAVKQAAEFGLTQNNRKMVVFLMFLQEVNAIGLKAAQGLYITDGFYWDQDEQTRAWSRRFFARMNKMPSKSQANTYAAVTNYLKALDAAKSDDAATVMRQMKSTKADYFGKPVSIRQNGRVAYDLTVYEVKSPPESMLTRLPPPAPISDTSITGSLSAYPPPITSLLERLIPAPTS